MIGRFVYNKIAVEPVSSLQKNIMTRSNQSSAMRGGGMIRYLPQGVKSSEVAFL